MTELEAINEMLDAAELPPVEAVAEGEGLTAQRYLDREMRRLCARGLPETVDEYVTLTAADIGGSVYKIAVGATALAIEGAGPNAGDALTIRKASGTAYVYDRRRATDQFASGTTKVLDIVRSVDFDDASERLQVGALAHAKYWYVRGVFRDMPEDLAERLMDDISIAEAQLSIRGITQPDGNLPTIGPIVFGAAQQQGQQGRRR